MANKFERDEFIVKVTDHSYTMTLIYDRWGGMRIIKQSSTDYNTSKYQEIYLPKDAMINIALNILKKETSNAS